MEAFVSMQHAYALHTQTQQIAANNSGLNFPFNRIHYSKLIFLRCFIGIYNFAS